MCKISENSEKNQSLFPVAQAKVTSCFVHQHKKPKDVESSGTTRKNRKY